jgi:hypothetical protein
VTGKTGTVYVLLDPRGDTIRYVGQTSRPLSQRLGGHLSTRGTPMAQWVAELRALGLRPAIRPIVENVPDARLIDVETEQIRARRDEGWPLLNAEARNWPADVRTARRQVKKAQAVGGDLLREAEERLDRVASRHALDLEREANRALRRQLMYPDDPALQHAAVLAWMERWREDWDMPEEEWPTVAAAVAAMAQALRPHGFTLEHILTHGKLFEGVYYHLRSEFDHRRWQREEQAMGAAA